MQIIDEIYGTYMLDGVLKELILSEPLQRLKGIYQGGASYFVNESWNVTRYDHSVGVMLLIQRLGGSIEEQIAGLLHDVSHTAFSHVIDFALHNKEENFHEEIYEQIIMASNIPHILTAYGYNYKELLDETRWTLLEQPAPELCADRIDYTLRDMYRYGNISMEEIHSFLEDLFVLEGKVYIGDVKTAEWFVRTYYMEVIDFFLNPLNVYGYDVLARTLKLALDKQLITIDTLLGRDEEVMALLRSLDDHDIKGLLDGLHPLVDVIEDRYDYDTHVIGKMRCIDPSIPINGQLVRSSSVSQEIVKMNQAAKQKAEEGMFVKVRSASK